MLFKSKSQIKVWLFLFLVLSLTSMAWADVTTIQGPTVVFDAYINTHTQHPVRRFVNLGGLTNLQIGAYELALCATYDDVARLFIKFDISSIPGSHIIDSAFFQALCYNKAKHGACGWNDQKTYAVAVLRAWNEGNSTGGYTWGDRAQPGEVTPMHRWFAESDTICSNGDDSCWYKMSGDSVVNSSGDREATIQDSVTLSSATSVWYSWDITDAVQRWYGETLTNNGITVFRADPAIVTVYEFRSSEYATASDRPKLVVYSTEVAVAGQVIIVH